MKAIQSVALEFRPEMRRLLDNKKLLIDSEADLLTLVWTAHIDGPAA